MLINDFGDYTELEMILAHGAGAGMQSPFMLALSERLESLSLRVHRFNFDYMEAIQRDGRRRPPDRMPRLLECFERQVAAVGTPPEQLFIAGKSMGGRVASLLATRLPVRGVLCYGYPFHPPGKPDNWRTAHLGELLCPMGVWQGTRDPFGTQEELSAIALPEKVEIRWIESGNHDLEPLRRSGLTQSGLLQTVAEDSLAFMRRHS